MKSLKNHCRKPFFQKKGSQTGKNFAAGMTSGVAYVLDENWDFYQRVNKETVSLEPVEHK